MREIRTTDEDDARIEAVVMRNLLALHPTQVTFEELLREIAGEEADFGERDAIDRAVHDLAGAGLVRRHEEVVVPTRAAVRLDELLG